jgi:hypothetical protein
MNDLERTILEDPTRLPSLNYLLYKHQFSEAFLAKTIEYYDSWICLKTQQNLTPAFCFTYLYDNATDSADNWTDFQDIQRYFQKQWPEKSEAEVERILKIVYTTLDEAQTSKKSNRDMDRNE